MCFLLLLRWGWSSRCFNSGAYKNNLVPQTYALSEVKYCIAGKFSEDFNLTVWKIVKKIAKFKFSAIIKHAIMHTTHMHMQLGLYTHVKQYLVMSLYKYSKKGPVLPTLRTCGDSSVSREAVKHANKQVKHTLVSNAKWKKNAVTLLETSITATR